MVKDAVPEADCLPFATAAHAPERQTCSETTRPARTGRKVSVAVAVLAVTRVVGMDNDAVCATTLRVLAELTYWARTFLAIVTRGANVLTEYDLMAGALKLVL